MMASYSARPHLNYLQYRGILQSLAPGQRVHLLFILGITLWSLQGSDILPFHHSPSCLFYTACVHDWYITQLLPIGPPGHPGKEGQCYPCGHVASNLVDGGRLQCSYETLNWSQNGVQCYQKPHHAPRMLQQPPGTYCNPDVIGLMPDWWCLKATQINFSYHFG